MSVIEAAWPDVEVYSIDEAFLDLSAMPIHLRDAFCADLQKKILKFTGVPTSIGIGQTKTLAKIANYICKKILKIPVFNVSEQRHWLSKISVGDVWGVGRRWQKKLMEKGINTAQDLAAMNAPMIRKQYNVLLMRTVMELQGIKCLSLDEAQPKQSIMSSKSFGEMQTQFSSLAQAISSHCARACEKARSQNLVAQRLYVFVRSNPFRQDLMQYANSIEFRLVNPTDDTRVITKIAKLCLKKLFKQGVYYKKVGIMLGDLINKSQRQLDLFHQPDDEALAKKDQLMTVFDTINRRYGSHTVKLAAEGFSKPWAMRSEKRSPCYTTRWSELPIVHT
jgi:DNA polymerase V